MLEQIVKPGPSLRIGPDRRHAAERAGKGFGGGDCRAGIGGAAVEAGESGGAPEGGAWRLLVVQVGAPLIIILLMMVVQIPTGGRR